PADDLENGILRGASAVISRPTDGIVYDPKHLVDVSTPFRAVTISVRYEQYALIKADPRVRILTGGGANATGVSELAVHLANLLLRPLHLRVHPGFLWVTG